MVSDGPRLLPWTQAARILGGVSSEFKGDVMEKLFEEKTVFITGGGTGIGQA
jgi:FlaA1/EpsC-like NDP-sugar epimerase